MKSRETLIRLKRFQVDEKRRRVSQIEAMIAEFSRMAGELDREIGSEEQRSGITDPSHFAYSTYARAARTRRANLENSNAELREQLDAAIAQLEEAKGELAKVENLEGRERAMERSAEAGPSRLGAAIAFGPVRA